MLRVYVAGPYRASTENGVAENIWNARVVALDLWGRGYAVLCPHMNTAFLGGAEDDQVWLAGDIEWLHFAELLVLAPGWENSSGTLEEKKFAEQHQIPVVVWDGQHRPLLTVEESKLLCLYE